MRLRTWGAWMLVLVIAGCGPSLGTDAGVDASTIDGATDGGHADARVPSDAATDARSRVDGGCSVADSDGDGVNAIGCGGEDCDDGDADRFPGNPEVCDAEGHDEDCNPTTLGPDADSDTFVSMACCNTQLDTTLLCGTDCDDERATVNPTAVEACNGIDDNCDRIVDNSVMEQDYYPDCDGDGFSSRAGRTAIHACAPPSTAPTECSGASAGWSPLATDCDDTLAGVHPAQPDACDGIDTDCDGALGAIEDGDADGFPSATCRAAAPSGASPAPADCDDTLAAVNPGVSVDACDGVDSDCDGSVEDGDGDGRFATASTCTGTKDDCDDVSAAVLPGATEACNGDDDDCDGVVDGSPASAWCNDPAHGGDARTTYACTGGSCAVGACATDYRDCSAGAGCETHVRDNVTSCGSCTNACMLACSGLACDEASDITVSSVGATSADGHFGCALRTSGAVSCWGRNGHGELGDGTSTDRTTPLRVMLASSALEVVAGSDFACARTATNVQCWGDGAGGRLGDGTTTSRALPAAVSSLTTTSALTAGRDHACVIASGQAKCWGDNSFGQLGDGTTMPRLSPVDVSGLADAIAISAAPARTCAIRTGGQGVCWGFDPVAGTAVSAPTNVAGLTDAIEISAGDNFACARRTSGQVVCWGDGFGGVLGNGGTAPSSSPVDVTGLSNAIALSAGENHACAIRSGGQAVCWGSNARGQLGNGTTSTTPSTTFVEVTGLSDAVAIAAGNQRTCALRATGQVVCWGSGTAGGLGDGSTADRSAPTNIASEP